MIRQRSLQVVLVLVGVLFTAAIYPIATALRHPTAADDTGDTMMMSLYFTMGIFLLLAVRNPLKYRSAIAFIAWFGFRARYREDVDRVLHSGRKKRVHRWLSDSRRDRRAFACATSSPYAAA